MYRFSVKSDPRWCCTYLLDATDPLFIEIGKAFVERQLQGLALFASLCVLVEWYKHLLPKHNYKLF